VVSSIFLSVRLARLDFTLSPSRRSKNRNCEDGQEATAEPWERDDGGMLEMGWQKSVQIQDIF
jgi:hypothetical protein